jgi:hypothetical protein
MAALNYTTCGDYMGLYEEEQGDNREEFEADTNIRLPKCYSLRLNHKLNSATDEHMNACRFGSSFPEIRLRGEAHNETFKFRATKPKQAT